MRVKQGDSVRISLRTDETHDVVLNPYVGTRAVPGRDNVLAFTATQRGTFWLTFQDESVQRKLLPFVVF